MAKIYLVDDDENILTSVSMFLEAEGYEVRKFHDGVTALEALKKSPPDLAVFDVKMPRMDGLELLRRLRQTSNLPVIFLTSKDDEFDEAIGFNMGADDYITKPFSTRELVVRINAMFRRVQATQNMDQSQTTLVIGSLVLDTVTREVHVDSVAVKLTAKEFDLLFQFMNAPNKVFKRTELLQLVWGQSYEGYLHTVNTHINRLRQKIEPNPKQPQYIVTEWGVGYKLCA